MMRGKNIGVSVFEGGRPLYARAAKARRTPASNQKLLLTMAVLDRMELGTRFETRLMARAPVNGVIKGNLYVVGSGDPTVTDGGAKLPFRPTRLRPLARKLRSAGVRRIGGAIVGSTRYFRRDWWAPGWKSDFPDRWIPRPTALSYDGNTVRGRHIRDPERRVAGALRSLLRDQGISVKGGARAGRIRNQSRVVELAQARSRPLRVLLQYMNRHSSNFFAEVLGKRLAVERWGPLGSIKKAARALSSFAASRNVEVRARDASGLSYHNSISTKGMARLLAYAETQEWGDDLRDLLPSGGEGTLDKRLHGVPLRAKTGTLNSVSALSGWIWLRRTRSWAGFSIMSRGMYDSTAKSLEDRIVRLLNERAR